MILSLNGIIAGKGASPLMNGLISMYKAQSNELDSYGTNNGSPFGGLLYVPGKQGNGFRFNGSNSYVQLPNNAFSIQDFSISLWFNAASFSADRTIFSNVNGDGNNVNTGYWLSTTSTGIIDFWMYGGTSSFVATGYRYNALSINTWYNITLTKTQNNQPIMHVNGSIVTPTITNYGGGTINPVYSFGAYTYSTPCIGAYIYNNASSKALYGSSTTDEIGIWNRQLTSTEITELYNSGSGKFYPY
jgi:hypothetical protein